MKESKPMRPRFDTAQAAILRAATEIATPFGARVVIVELRARDWASLTLRGARHDIDLRLDGPGAADALAAMAAQLPHANVSIAGQLLAELVVEPGTADGSGVPLNLAALVIDD